MKKLTERQLKRRADILEAARQLIAERGYGGVTMRELAERSGVVVKTLYLLYENKEVLLTTAIEQGHEVYYADLDEAEIDTGLDRLFFIIESVTSDMLVDDEYVKTMAPVLMFGTNSTVFKDVRRQTYGKAIEQIAGEGDLLPWASVDLITPFILRHVISTYVEWSNGEITTVQLGDILKFHTCLTLLGFTQGRTHERAQETLKTLAGSLENQANK
jgi:AcrR family transcriptional regulator